MPGHGGQSDTPPIIGGFIVGLLAPVFELIGSLMWSAFRSAAPDIWGTGILLSGAVIIVVVDLFRNVIIGLSRSEFAVGNVFGSIIGLILFGGVIFQDSGEAFFESVLLTLALTGSFVLSLYLTFFSD